MTRDELQKRIDGVIAKCIRNDYAFGSYAHEVTEVVWPVLEAAEQTVQDYLRIDGEKAQISQRLEAAEKERNVLKAKVERMEKRLRLILEEPENTMSNSKAMREMLKQARLALESK